MEKKRDELLERLVADVLGAFRDYYLKQQATGSPLAATLPLEALPGDASRREEALRVWRREVANRKQLPAYVVLTNRTLRAIAVRDPSTGAELGTISGIGPSKREAYGASLLQLLAKLRTSARAPDLPAGSFRTPPSACSGPPALAR